MVCVCVKVGEHLDRHLMFPLLYFLSEKDVYPREKVMEGMLALAKQTNMTDWALELHAKLHGDTSADAEESAKEVEAMRARRKVILDRVRRAERDAERIVRFLSDAQLVSELGPDREANLMLLRGKFGILEEDVDALYAFALVQFECGNYAFAGEFMDQFRQLSMNVEKLMSATWGRLASAIMTHDFDCAMEELMRLKEYIDNAQYPSHEVQLMHRTWLLHWSLFVFFNHANGRNAIIDLFLQERYVHTIETTCPHLVRYLAAVVICNKRRRNLLKDVVRLIRADRARYEDPVTQFLEHLCIDYDFEAAQEKLAESEELMSRDFFLASCRDDFVENGRLFLFEAFCRVHKVIDIKVMATRFGMDEDAALQWIVNLIKTKKIAAKIDAEKGTVVMTTTQPDVHEQIIEKTRSQLTKTRMMAAVLGGA